MKGNQLLSSEILIFKDGSFWWKKTKLFFENFPMEKSMIISNFKFLIFREKIEILEFQFFIDFSIEQVSENNFVFFLPKAPIFKNQYLRAQKSVSLQIWFKMTAQVSSRWENYLFNLNPNRTKTKSKKLKKCNRNHGGGGTHLPAERDLSMIIY